MRPLPSRKRLPDWAERLAALVEERRNAPFEWGVQDCCTLAADAALAITGADPLADWRGRYASEEEAETRIGPEGLEAAVAAGLAAWGAPECPVAFAQRGDWALVSVGNQLVCGVVLGAVVAAPGRDGIAFVPVSRMQRAWSI
ncbi:hypothetical protein HMPREF9946_02239 [Acetobacteraceae bacterium AT-5844]|nr:hypothetical protein HMPREF9946_02239 [Acetobacteraceae bacterium AT-5844]